MSEYEMMQWAAILGGGVVFVAIVVLIARFSMKISRFYPDFAREYGLTHRRQSLGSSFTNRSAEDDYIEGTFEGVPVQLHVHREQVGRTRLTCFRAAGRCLAPVNRQFTMHIEYGGQAPAFHRVMTGDPQFDGPVCVKSDTPDAAQTLLADPAVRAAMGQAAWKLRSFGIVYDRGEITIAAGIWPMQKSELETPLRAVVAACRARLA